MTRFETREADWLSFPEAVERIVEAARPAEGSLRPIGAVLGLAVSDVVTSPFTLPPGPSSHMDGYAVRSDDLEASGAGGWPHRPLSVVGTSRPGHPWTGTLPAGGAVRVMTGGLLPAGADTVIPVEDTDREAASAGQVHVRPRDGEVGPPPRGRYVRPAGEEVRAGSAIAEPGDTVTPTLLTLLAHTGAATVPVHPAPRVGLVVTGDELVEAGDPEALEGGVRRADILSPVLPALVRDAAGEPLAPRRAGDDLGELERVLEEVGAEADLLVTTGGASMGETDLVKRALDNLGFELDFWRVRMRPGSPVSLGRLRSDGREGAIPVIGLPGNPVSAITTFFLLASPAIRALGGHARRSLPAVRATARERFAGPPHLTRFFRVRLEPEREARWGAVLTGHQGSGVLQSLADADGFARVPEGTEAIEPGEPVSVFLLPRWGWPTNV